MATVEVIKTEKIMQSKVKVSIEGRTSVGRFTFPVVVEDHGSTEANEAEALRELQRLVGELSEALRLRLGP